MSIDWQWLWEVVLQILYTTALLCAIAMLGGTAVWVWSLVATPRQRPSQLCNHDVWIDGYRMDEVGIPVAVKTCAECGKIS